MIDKERVHALAKELRRCQFNFYEEIITEWLEQNQPEPIVTGLTDEQIKDLACVVSSVDYDDFHTTRYDVLIQNWFKKQTFTQEVQAVAVGLSDEQVNSLFEYFPYKATKEDFIEGYNTWAKTQTFTQPEQFTPSWDDAPSWANWVAQDGDGQWQWYNKKPVAECGCWASHKGNYDSARGTIKTWQQTLQERPKPTPVVTVGETWIHTKTGNKYYVDGFCQSKINDEWVKSVMYHVGGARYTRTLDDFIAKFEKVQS